MAWPFFLRLARVLAPTGTISDNGPVLFSLSDRLRPLLDLDLIPRATVARV